MLVRLYYHLHVTALYPFVPIRQHMMNNSYNTLTHGLPAAIPNKLHRFLATLAQTISKSEVMTG